nr:MAG TPA: hypothetical protein [Bacteriophage sp.]
MLAQCHLPLGGRLWHRGSLSASDVNCAEEMAGHFE